MLVEKTPELLAGAKPQPAGSILTYRAKPKLYHFDAETKGYATNVKADVCTQYVIATFQNGSFAFYDLKTQAKLKEIEPPNRCLINN